MKVNGEVKTSPKLMLDEDDEVTTHIPEKADYSEHTLPVIFEDDNVIVINKPSGILTHSKGALNDEFTVAEFIAKKISFPEATNRNGIVHRLDRDTSGVIICAKNPETLGYLQKQFQARKVKKTYLAIVKGKPKLFSGVIDLPIERNPKKPSQFRVGVNGKTAQTEFRVLAGNVAYSLVELRPQTGRTHQLRVHMAHIKNPIIGDPVYDGGKSPIGRLCLHAQSLEITIPGSKREIFTAELPEDFTALVESIKRG